MSSDIDEYLNNYIQEEIIGKRSVPANGNSFGSSIIDLPKIDKMSGKEFEKFCAELLKWEGFSSISITKESGDHGVDVIAYKAGISYAIQCKRHKKSIGNKAIQEVYTGRAIYKLDKALVITNNDFSSQAIDDAKKLDVELWDRKTLKARIKRLENERRREEAEEQRKAEREKREEERERKKITVPDEKGFDKPAYGGANLHVEDVFHASIYNRNNDIRLVLGKDFHGNDIITSLVNSQNILLFGCSIEEIYNMLHCFALSILVGATNYNMYVIETNGYDMGIYKDTTVVEHTNSMYEATSMIYRVVSEIKQRLAIKAGIYTKSVVQPDCSRIIILIEDFVDLFRQNGDLEQEVVFIAQNGSNVGVHLIMATQNPGFTSEQIMNCIPVRACLKVSNSQESKIALGDTGAELLSGMTDFLFKGKNMGVPMHIRAPLISDGDKLKAIKCTKDFFSGELCEEPNNEKIKLSTQNEKDGKFLFFLKRKK